jgi:GT2 family glycosyltransferase
MIIPPVPSATPQPLWSVMIPTYNCAAYLKETLASVLAQDPGADLMQIEVVDDHSTEDDPASVVAEIGSGRVMFYQQPTNVGHVRNFNTCLRRSRGQLIHLLHGDDGVRDGFYQSMQLPFQSPTMGAAFCRYIAMDEQGHWLSISPLEQRHSGPVDHWLEKIATGQRLQTPTMVVRRAVYEALGGFDERIASYGEDWEMWVRIAARYPVWYEPDPLALYRIRSTSLTGVAERTGKNAQDYRRVIEINRTHLPPNWADHLSNEARRNFAMACLRRARRKLEIGETGTTLAQMREALKTHRSLPVVVQSLQLLLLWLARAGSTARAKRR